MSRLQNQRETRAPGYGRTPGSDLDRDLTKAVEDSAQRVGQRVAAALAARMGTKLPKNA